MIICLPLSDDYFPLCPFMMFSCPPSLTDGRFEATFSQRGFRSNAQTINFFKRLFPKDEGRGVHEVKCQLDFRRESNSPAGPSLAPMHDRYCLSSFMSDGDLCFIALIVFSPSAAGRLCLKHLKYCREDLSLSPSATSTPPPPSPPPACLLKLSPQYQRNSDMLYHLSEFLINR